MRERAILTFGTETALANDIAHVLRGEPVKRAAFADPIHSTGLVFGDDGA